MDRALNLIRETPYVIGGLAGHGYYPATGDTRASSMLSSAFTNIHKKAPIAVSSAAKSKAWVQPK
jgi:hypothetical protein